MIRLDAATVLLQWSTGGLAFVWLTSRHRDVALGFGRLLRMIFISMAGASLAASILVHAAVGLEVADAGLIVTAAAALVVSWTRRGAGAGVDRAVRERRRRRVAAMTGRTPPATNETSTGEFPPILDLPAPIIGGIGLVWAAVAAGGPHALAIARTLVGAAFLGGVTDAMLLGHWYLVQPGLSRVPIRRLTRQATMTWPAEMAVLLWPTGMVSVLRGSVDDGWHGILGWFWSACAVSTIVFLVLTRAALREKAYSAVMAATGLLYLAILTATGTDLIARAILSR